MFDLPDLNWTATDPAQRPGWGASRSGWQALLEVLRAVPDIAEARTVTIVNGHLTPTGSCIRMETEGGLAGDVLGTIDYADFPAGHRIYLSLVNESHLVTVEHRAGGLGQIDLASGQDVVLTSTKQWLVLERKGTAQSPGTEWEEVQSMPPLGALTWPLKNDVHFGGYGVAGAKPIVKDVSVATRTYDPSFNPADVTAGDNGKKLVFTNASGCVMTLPASGVQPEDYFLWEQFSAGQIIFAVASGAVLINALGHDRSYGNGAIGICHVRRVSPVVEWVLNGTTAAAGTGGGGGGGGVMGRTVVPPAFATQATTITATTYQAVNGASITHTPGDNETWLYIATCVVSAVSSDALNPATVRFWHETADLTLGEWGRGRFTDMREGALSFYVKTYGASNPAQIFRLQAKNGSTTAGDSITISSGGIIPIRLEADEAGTFVASAAGNATTTYATAATLNLTAVADDYLILVSADVFPSTVATIDVRMQVDGVEEHARTVTRAGPNYGRYSVLVAQTFSAGAHTITVQHRATAAGPTAQIRNITIAAVRKAKFPYWHVSSDMSEEGLTSSTAYAAKLSLQAGLTTGWQYLMLAGCDAYASEDAPTAHVKTRIMRNGAQVGEELRSGTRLANSWCVTGPSQAALVQLQQAQDTFELQWAGASATYQYNLKGAVVAVLGLRKLV